MQINFNGQVISGTPEEINEFIRLNTPSRIYSSANDGQYYENEDPSYASGFPKPQWKKIYTLVHYRINYDLDTIKNFIYDSYTYRDHAMNVADQMILRMHEADAEDCRVEDIQGVADCNEETSDSDNICCYKTWYHGVDVSGTPYCEKIIVCERRLDYDE